MIPLVHRFCGDIWDILCNVGTKGINFKLWELVYPYYSLTCHYQSLNKVIKIWFYVYLNYQHRVTWMSLFVPIVLLRFAYHDDVIKWKHFPCYWPCVRGIHRSPVNSLYKGQWRGGALMFSVMIYASRYIHTNDANGVFAVKIETNILSMPDSSSTTSPIGASLSDLLFSFVLEKYIVCEVCGLRSPSFESSSVLHISPTDTPSMQNLILEGLQQKLQKSCSRCNRNTRHIESSYILQPPKYLLLFVNRFRYLDNNIIKDRCPIPLDTTVMLGPLKFNLQATIDHHGPSIDSGHYTASINCCKKTFYCNDHKITEFGTTDKNSSTAYIVLYKWIDTWFLDSNRRVGVWSLPWRWHILSIPLTTGRGTSAETCGFDDVFPPDDLGSRPEALC